MVNMNPLSLRYLPPLEPSAYLASFAIDLVLGASFSTVEIRLRKLGIFLENLQIFIMNFAIPIPHVEKGENHL